MIHLRAVRQAKTQIIHRRPHHADVKAPGPAVGINFTVYGRRHILLTGQIPHLQISRRVLNGHTGAEAHLLRKLPGNVGVEVKGENLSGNTAFGKRPVVVVFRAHAEGNGHGKAHPDVVCRLMADVTEGNGLGVGAPVFGRAVVTLVVQVKADSDKACLNLRARMQGHRGGVVENTGNIGAVNAGARVGAAQGRCRLLGQHKAGSVGGRGHCNQSGNGDGFHHCFHFVLGSTNSQKKIESDSRDRKSS